MVLNKRDKSANMLFCKLYFLFLVQTKIFFFHSITKSFVHFFGFAQKTGRQSFWIKLALFSPFVKGWKIGLKVKKELLFLI